MTYKVWVFGVFFLFHFILSRRFVEYVVDIEDLIDIPIKNKK